MARKRTRDTADVVSDLLELADRLGLPDGAFDGEVSDTCHYEAENEARRINGGPLIGQFEFLLEHGWPAGRLSELIREMGG
jgi:hypothetical protein